MQTSVRSIVMNTSLGLAAALALTLGTERATGNNFRICILGVHGVHIHRGLPGGFVWHAKAIADRGWLLYRRGLGDYLRP